MATTKHVENVIDNNGKAREVEVFVFHNPSKRKKEDKGQVIPRKAAATTSQAQKKAKAQTGSLSLESVRHDVRNLGIRGLAGRTKIEAELSQLKSLGAKIPKNWERRMDRKKRNLDFERRRQDLKAGMKTKKKADPNKSIDRSQEKRKKGKEEGVFFDGQVGTYKGGVQYISAADIQKIRSSVSKR